MIRSRLLWQAWEAARQHGEASLSSCSADPEGVATRLLEPSGGRLTNARHLRVVSESR